MIRPAEALAELLCIGRVHSYCQAMCTYLAVAWRVYIRLHTGRRQLHATIAIADRRVGARPIALDTAYVLAFSYFTQLLSHLNCTLMSFSEGIVHFTGACEYALIRCCRIPKNRPG